MPLVESSMLELGTAAPTFSLTDVVTEQTVTIDSLAGAPLLVMFMCSHCPFVKHLEVGIGRLAEHAVSLGVGVVAIGSNDPVKSPDDAPAGLAAQASRNGWAFPYLFDATQEVATAYSAVCTPDFFLFDAEHRLAYRGRFDASRPGNDIPVTGDDLRAAIDSVAAGEPVAAEQFPSSGCSIKWR